MKNTGIMRKVDELGRIVIPIEIRNKFNIVENDKLEIFIDNSNIVLKKYETGCIFCSNTKNLVEIKGKFICENCKRNIESFKFDK